MKSVSRNKDGAAARNGRRGNGSRLIGKVWSEKNLQGTLEQVVYNGGSAGVPRHYWQSPTRFQGLEASRVKFLTSQLTYFLKPATSRRNIRLLLRFLLVLAILVTVYSILFHVLMVFEGREHSWITGVYWTLTVMSTLGFGDITFTSDAGRAFSIVVLLSGMVFLLILLPFTFIEFFYAPWMKAQAEARAPRQLPESASGHVILTNLDPVSNALMQKLTHYGYPYALLVNHLEEALRLHDLGFQVVLAESDRPETYRLVRAEQAALVAATGNDMANTNVAFTVREMSQSVPIVTTANSERFSRHPSAGRKFVCDSAWRNDGTGACSPDHWSRCAGSCHRRVRRSVDCGSDGGGNPACGEDACRKQSSQAHRIKRHWNLETRAV